MAYTEVDRDMVLLVGKRVGEAVFSVIQLCDDPSQQLKVATAAVSNSAGIWAGVFDVLHAGELGGNPVELKPSAVLLALSKRFAEEGM